ncbi:MAG: patatin-like phospholipase family protein [Pseudomonadota bacterium]
MTAQATEIRTDPPRLAAGASVMVRRLIALAAAGLLLSGCVSGSRSVFAAEDRAAAVPMGITGTAERPVRFYLDDASRVAFFEASIRRGLPVGPDGRMDMVALSGGGANGAFTAGIMAGWTASGTRPDIEIVTGVSTGALAAPFVFLGPEWDDELAEAYLGGGAARLLQPQGLGALFGSGVFRGEPLRDLVESFIDGAVLEAVAAEAAKGRVLLVATTDLDSQRGVSWDMGAIASRGGPEALALFRDVLIASASIPGAFPPVLIPSESGGRRFEEMHVDGGVATPFLALPETFWSYRDQAGRLEGARLYVIVNGRLAPSFEITRDSVGGVLSRTVDTVMLSSLTTTLAGNRAFADRNGLVFRYASLPDDNRADPLDFSVESMRPIYEIGRGGALDGSIWR